METTDPTEALFKCNTCKACFANVEKIKEHYKSDWHVLNSKRRAGGLAPIKRDDFKNLGLKSKTAPSNPPKPVVAEPKDEPPVKVDDDEDVWEDVEDETPLEVAPHISIFDNKVFDSADDCVQYMALEYGFFIPDVEYLVDRDGLLQYLGEKVKLGGYCLYCQKQMRPGRPCQNHMLSKSHCKIAYEEGVDADEFEDFYDFSSSYVDEEVELDEDGNVIEKTMEISPIGELILPNGRVVGHRDFRLYYKQHYRPEETRPSVLNQQREELLRLGYKFNTANMQSYEVSNLSDTEVMTMLVKYHKDIRKSQIVEQRAQSRQLRIAQRRETRSAVNKLRSSATTTEKIRDYHKIL